jgi:hypothetical protein
MTARGFFSHCSVIDNPHAPIQTSILPRWQLEAANACTPSARTSYLIALKKANSQACHNPGFLWQDSHHQERIGNPGLH